LSSLHGPQQAVVSSLDRANAGIATYPHPGAELLRLSRSTVEALTGMQRQLIRALERDALLAARVERLASIPGVGWQEAL
jgi:hypothetical protein